MTDKTTTLGERIAEHVGHRASDLQARYRRDDADAVATLAVLRRGVAVPLGKDVRLVGLTVAGLYEHPEQILGDEPTKAENAVYAALTLFAVHQQSHRDAAMHRRGYSFGRSARLLGRHSGARDAVRARFTALATATSWEETVHHARGIIQQLRAHGIPLDYAQFARDLYSLRFADSADRVRLVWGRHFYREDGPDGEEATSDDAHGDVAETTQQYKGELT